MYKNHDEEFFIEKQEILFIFNGKNLLSKENFVKQDIIGKIEMIESKKVPGNSITDTIVFFMKSSCCMNIEWELFLVLIESSQCYRMMLNFSNFKFAVKIFLKGLLAKNHTIPTTYQNFVVFDRFR